MERRFLKSLKILHCFEKSPPTGLLVGFFVSGVNLSSIRVLPESGDDLRAFSSVRSMQCSTSGHFLLLGRMLRHDGKIHPVRKIYPVLQDIHGIYSVFLLAIGKE